MWKGMKWQGPCVGRPGGSGDAWSQIGDVQKGLLGLLRVLLLSACGIPRRWRGHPVQTSFFKTKVLFLYTLSLLHTYFCIVAFHQALFIVLGLPFIVTFTLLHAFYKRFPLIW